MTVQPTIEYRAAGSDAEWTRKDPADRAQWQWHDSADWLAAEALWELGEGSEVRLVSTGIGHPNLDPEEFGDHTPLDGGSGCLSLNPPADNPPVPADAHWYGEPVKGAGQPDAPFSSVQAMHPDREHLTELNPGGTGKLRAWLASPNGSLTMGRVTFEAVAGGGILVRTQPYRPAS